MSILDGSVIVVSLISFMTKGTLSQLPLVSDLQTLEAYNNEYLKRIINSYNSGSVISEQRNSQSKLFSTSHVALECK